MHDSDENQLLPLSDFTSRILGNPKPSHSDLGYVAVRASVLYGLVSDHIDKVVCNAIGASPDLMQHDEHDVFREKVAVCQNVAMIFELQMNNLSKELFMSRAQAIAAAYTRLSEVAVILNNNPMSPFIVADLEAADAVYPVFKVINEGLETAKRKNSI